MYHKSITELPEIYINQQIMYLDDKDLSQRTGVVMNIEQVNENLAFVYVASLNKDENDKQEGTLFYRDIFVFDNLVNETEEGIIKDLTRHYSQKFLGKD